LLELNHNLHVTLMDFAKSAIDIVKQHPAFRELTARTTEHAASSSSTTSSARIEAFHVCLVTGLLPTPADSQHLALCMFVLSAIAPENLQTAVNKLAKVLKPGGRLLVRDYAKYDEAQLRFSNTSKIQDNFYVRNDGTCSYFFDVPFLRSLCEIAGLKCIECHYINKRDVNRQQQKERNRIWIHGVFEKSEL
jgi:methyltransferase-like protein 6